MNYNPFTLQNKTILITGASSGIGRTVAVECSKMGANLIISGRDNERLKETLSLLKSNDNHRVIVADLSMPDNLDELIEKLPELDGVVNCAAILKKLPLKFINKHAWKETMDINFFAPAFLIHGLFKKNKLKLSSSIVFISSIASSVASYGNISYMASKGAINSMSRGIALELAPKKIRVNIVQPALIQTNLINNVLSDEDLKNYVLKFPLGRFGKPEEVAYAIIYLLSDASEWITGTSIIVDGGVTLR